MERIARAAGGEVAFTLGGRIRPAAEDHFRELSQAIASIRGPHRPHEQRGALTNSIYRGIRTCMAVAVQRGIAVQILTFGLERRFGISLKHILQRFSSAARPQTHVLPRYSPSALSVSPNRGATAL